MSPGERAAVVGLGLLGGSIARDLAARGVRVAAYDRDRRAVEAAVAAGVVADALGADLAGAEDADVVLIAVPVTEACAVLDALAPRAGRARLVTDVGSTKRGVVAHAARVGLGARFVGAHPLAGDHRSGWEAGREGLVAGARVFLSPSPDTTAETLDAARAFWGALGGRPEVVDAEAHDLRLAWTSHLPQATSTALALALDAMGIPRGDLGSGGRDVTRLAGGSPDMWTAIALENAAPLAAALAEVESTIAYVRGAVERRDERAIRDCLERGRTWFEAG